MYVYTPLVKWKAQPIEFKDIRDHAYSMISNYYMCKNIRGVLHYKVTVKGVWKLNEKCLCKDIHNFMVYLLGYGNTLITEEEFTNGEIR